MSNENATGQGERFGVFFGAGFRPVTGMTQGAILFTCNQQVIYLHFASIVEQYSRKSGQLTMKGRTNEN
jgi:hypothetical protein